MGGTTGGESLDQAVALEGAERLGEQVLGDAADLAEEIALSAVHKGVDDERGPMAGDPVEDHAGRPAAIQTSPATLL